jgi:GntR family transcriptional regulator
MSDIRTGPRVVTDAIKEIWRNAATQGKRLPSEPDLAATTGSSRPAVRETLIRLEERGYIHRSQGTGTAVNPELLRVKARIDEQVDHSEIIAGAGMSATLRVLRQEIAPVTAEEAGRFRVEAGLPAFRTVKAWFADGQAVALAADSVPIRLSDIPSADMDASASVFSLAETLGLGRPVWETVWVTAALVSEQEAWMLNLSEPQPAVCLVLHGIDSRGMTCYWSRELQVNGPIEFAMVRPVHQA